MRENYHLKILTIQFLKVGSVANELEALVDNGWTVPKLAHELGKSERQVKRWLKGAKCKAEIRRKIKALIMRMV
ncbi:helix-turn-helix domain-containing protein [Nitrosomonas ureae]|uniref:helix-turn-helix domain-containing protein n=1 Tax=Nitrosomonas ureae TaxID=44577 RepID=UPI00114250BE